MSTILSIKSFHSIWSCINISYSISDDIYSNVALLLSEQCPSTIKAVTFAGVDQSVFQDRREFTGSLFQQMEDLYAYLDLHNQTKATFEGLYRTDTKDYPEDALRETLMNSLVHRDYSFSASTLSVSMMIESNSYPWAVCLPESLWMTLC